ncbi:hypothetical protein RHMOL_Rhmol06G0279100 [Rhododendron molle]|uniref:Uncharacterized protein n=1 Tax=Rhododendron molle TaxID=49168 RepID=A0ACC0NJ27_RHOML|nr:hypothetical protein RHMOL_Rhmol06G0279100 [Rhododendron molle]
MFDQNSAAGMEKFSLVYQSYGKEAGADCGTDVDLEEMIEKILVADDVERLITLLTSPALLIDGTPQYCRDHLLESLCMNDAVKCATALLEGKLGGITLDLDGDHLLHRAARFCSSDLVQLFLLHKARSDLRNGLRLRPLDKAFDFARSQYPSLESYPFGGQSTFEMILYLCQLGAGNIGDTIKFLACSSKDVAKEAYHYARKGKLIELVLLLIVAREKILVPINLNIKGGVGSSGRTTILHWLQIQTLMLTHEEKLMGDCKNGKLTKIRGKKMVMRSAALLLEVFERAGHAIEEIIQYLSRSPYARSEEVGKHAVFWFKEAGFKFKKGDFDFSTMDWFDIVLTDPLRTKNRTPTKDAPSAETNSSPRLPLRQQPIPSLPVRQIWDLSSLMSKTPTNYLLLTSTEGQPLEVLRLVWVGFS